MFLMIAVKTISCSKKCTAWPPSKQYRSQKCHPDSPSKQSQVPKKCSPWSLSEQSQVPKNAPSDLRLYNLGFPKMHLVLFFRTISGSQKCTSWSPSLVSGFQKCTSWSPPEQSQVLKNAPSFLRLLYSQAPKNASCGLCQNNLRFPKNAPPDLRLCNLRFPKTHHLISVTTASPSQKYTS